MPVAAEPCLLLSCCWPWYFLLVAGEEIKCRGEGWKKGGVRKKVEVSGEEKQKGGNEMEKERERAL